MARNTINFGVDFALLSQTVRVRVKSTREEA
jgi:hypothetical protein